MATLYTLKVVTKEKKILEITWDEVLEENVEFKDIIVELKGIAEEIN